MGKSINNGYHADGMIAVEGTPEGKPGKKAEKVAASLARLDETLLLKRRQRLAQLLSGTRFYPADTSLTKQYYHPRVNKDPGQSKTRLRFNGVVELRGGVDTQTPIVPDEVAAAILEPEHFMDTAERILRERGEEL